MDKIFFGTKIVGEGEVNEVKGYFKSPADAQEMQAAHWSFAGEIIPCAVLLDEDESIRRDSRQQVIGAW